MTREPISYSMPGAYWRPRGLKYIGILSLFVGLLSAFVCEKVIVAEHEEMSQITQDQRRRGEAYQDEFRSRQFAAACIWGISVVVVGLAVLLIVAAILLLFSDFHGVFLHRLYAVLQMFASLVMTVILISVIADSPAGMVAFLGAIPGVIFCIYPVAVLVLLGRMGKPERDNEETPQGR